MNKIKEVIYNVKRKCLRCSAKFVSNEIKLVLNGKVIKRSFFKLCGGCRKINRKKISKRLPFADPSMNVPIDLS